MSTDNRPVYIPRSPAEHFIAELASIFAAILLGIPASIGFFAALFALTNRDPGAGALVGVQIGILLASLVALGHMVHHLRWTLPILRAMGRSCLWLLFRPRLPARERPQAVILPPPPRPQLAGMRIVPGKGLQYIRDDRDHFNHEDKMVDVVPADTAEHVIVRTPDSADLCLVIEEGIYQGDWSRSTLCSRRAVISQPRWKVATDRLVAMGILAPGKTDLEADLDSIRIVEPSEIQP